MNAIPVNAPVAQPLSSTPLSRPERLNSDDDLFIRMERAIGIPVINQCVWQLGPDVDEAFINRLGERLSRGRLSRKVIRRRLPVRDRWFHTPEAGVVGFDGEPVPAGAASAWARAQAEAGVDSVTGPSWRLTAARCADSDATLVSLVFSHVVADGGAVMTAIDEAVDDIAYDTTNPAPSVRDGLRDGVSMLRDSGRAAWQLIRSPKSPPPRPTNPTPPGPDGSADSSVDSSVDELCTTASVILTVDDDAFVAAAGAASGTPNSLFAAIVLGVLQDTGRISEGDVVPVSLPMSTRLPGDRRGNATSGVSALVTVDAARYADLGPIRTACKDAYVGLAEGPGPMALMGRIAQPLGDGLVRKLAGNSPGPLCLASNLGELSPAFATLGSAAPGPVAMRSVMPRVPRSTVISMAGGVSAWASRSAGVMTLCITALDPSRVADDAALTALLSDELARWGLTGKPWGA